MQKEWLLGGYASADLKKGNLGWGYGVYCTNKRIIGTENSGDSGNLGDVLTRGFEVLVGIKPIFYVQGSFQDALMDKVRNIKVDFGLVRIGGMGGQLRQTRLSLYDIDGMKDFELQKSDIKSLKVAMPSRPTKFVLWEKGVVESSPGFVATDKRGRKAIDVTIRNVVLMQLVCNLLKEFYPKTKVAHY